MGANWVSFVAVLEARADPFSFLKCFQVAPLSWQVFAKTLEPFLQLSGSTRDPIRELTGSTWKPSLELSELTLLAPKVITGPGLCRFQRP